MKSLKICRCCRARDTCIFAEVGEDRLRAHWVRHAERDTIFHQDEPAFGLYIVYQGKVMLFKRALDGQRRIFDIAGPAGVLGEEALLHDTNYALSAQALTKVQLLFIARADMLVLLEHPSVRQRLFARMLQRLCHAEELLLEVRYLSAGERLARLLLRLAQEHGAPQPNGRLALDLALTQAELGEMVGLSRETVSKYLNGFKDQGVIEVGRRLVIDPLALGRALHPASAAHCLDEHLLCNVNRFTAVPKATC